MRLFFSKCSLALALFGVCFGVKPVWKTPVSEPNPNANVQALKEHSNLAKRAQPNYYTRPEQVSIPDYRASRPNNPSFPQPSPPKFPYQQVPPHQLTSGGNFRPFAWIGPQPKAGSPQTSYYERAPNKGQFPNGFPPLPPNWQQYPVQMIWIPDTPEQAAQPYLYYPGPAAPPLSTGSYGLYGPTSTTESPMKPSAYPDTYRGTIAHSPAVNPVTYTVPYELPNAYGGSQTQVTLSSGSPDTSTTSDGANERSNYQRPTVGPTTIGVSDGNGLGKPVNPTIRPGPQEPSGGSEITTKYETSSLPYDADFTRDIEPGTTSYQDADRGRSTSSPGQVTASTNTNDRSSSASTDSTPFKMTSNPFSVTVAEKTVPPIYMGSDEEDENPPEDISKVTESPESSENSQIPGSPGTLVRKITESERPASFESTEERSREHGNKSSTPTPGEEEEEMMKNFFPRPVSSQAYQPPGHQPEDFSSHINVNFKNAKGQSGCVTPPCRGVDTDKISLYKPDRYNKGSGPTLVISNAAKDDASRAGYIPAPPPINPYIPPPPPPHLEEEYATPYTVAPENQPFPPFRNSVTPPRSLIPPHNLPPPNTIPPDEDYHETTTETIRPTAQTISTRALPPITTSTPSPVESTTTEEDTPEYVPPAIAHMTASTTSGKSPPTYKPLYPETTSPESTPSRSTGETTTPASVTRQPIYPSKSTPPVDGNTTHGPFSAIPPGGISNPTTEGLFTQVFTDREKTDSGEIVLSTTQASSEKYSEYPSSQTLSTSSTPSSSTTEGWTNTTPGSDRDTSPGFPTLLTSEHFTPSESLFTTPHTSEATTTRAPLIPANPLTSPPEQFENVTSSSIDRLRPSEFTTSPSPPSTTSVVSASFPPIESSSPGILPSTNSPPRNNPYAPPQGAPVVPNRLIGKPRILCLEDGISFEAKSILPFTGEIFANDRKRIPECQKAFIEDAKPKLFLPFSTCGVKNVGEQADNRAKYHMQVVLLIDQGNGTNTLQSFMAQCVHQKVNYNKKVLPKRIEEALEELRLVPSKLEQKASMPSVLMQIVVDEGHHKLGAEVSAADIGMPLALKWSMAPESDAYGMHIRNCKVVDAVGKIDHTLIDEQGCSADLQIIDHPHYDTYHDTASAHMWAFKVPDMSSLQIKCDILICSNIKSSVTNTTSCEDIPSPPFCADVVTSPPNSILSDASSFMKHRRASVASEVSPTTQSVRTWICLSKTCRPGFSEEDRFCINTQLATTSTGITVAFLLFSISFQVIARTKRA